MEIIKMKTIKLPKCRTEMIIRALKVYEALIKNGHAKEDYPSEHVIYDLVGLCGLMNYDVAITMTATQFSKFTFENGIDLPQFALEQHKETKEQKS